METKFCVDCVHFIAHASNDFSIAKCKHPQIAELCLVSGNRIDKWCKVERTYGKCGPSGKMHEAYEPATPLTCSDYDGEDGHVVI